MRRDKSVFPVGPGSDPSPTPPSASLRLFIALREISGISLEGDYEVRGQASWCLSKHMGKCFSASIVPAFAATSSGRLGVPEPPKWGIPVVCAGDTGSLEVNGMNQV